MRIKYFPQAMSIIFYAVAIVGLSMLLVFIYGAITGLQKGTGIFQAPYYFRTLADALFYVGALVLMVGTFIEFFMKNQSGFVARKLLIPFTLARTTAYDDTAAYGKAVHIAGDGASPEGSGGWMIIFIGGLIIVCSLLFAIGAMK